MSDFDPRIAWSVFLVICAVVVGLVAWVVFCFEWLGGDKLKVTWVLIALTIALFVGAFWVSPLHIFWG